MVITDCNRGRLTFFSSAVANFIFPSSAVFSALFFSFLKSFSLFKLLSRLFFVVLRAYHRLSVAKIGVSVFPSRTIGTFIDEIRMKEIEKHVVFLFYMQIFFHSLAGWYSKRSCKHDEKIEKSKIESQLSRLYTKAISWSLGLVVRPVPDIFHLLVHLVKSV